MVHALPCFDCHLAIAPAALPVATQAYDIKPKAPESAFSAKLHPDILGISSDTSAEAARAILESFFKGRANAKGHPAAEIRQHRDQLHHLAQLQSSRRPGQNGEVLSGSFSSPASANRAYLVARNLTFAEDRQPTKADMVKEVMGKYGAPTIVGDQHLYYIYRAGSIVSAGTKYRDAMAIDAIDKPLDPRPLKLNGETIRGSCVAVVKRAQAKEKTLAAMLVEAKGANCDGVVSVQLVPGTAPDRVGIAQFVLLDIKGVISAAAIDNDAVAAEQNERNASPKGSAPKLSHLPETRSATDVAACDAEMSSCRELSPSPFARIRIRWSRGNAGIFAHCPLRGRSDHLCGCRSASATWATRHRREG